MTLKLNNANNTSVLTAISAEDNTQEDNVYVDEPCKANENPPKGELSYRYEDGNLVAVAGTRECHHTKKQPFQAGSTYAEIVQEAEKSTWPELTRLLLSKCKTLSFLHIQRPLAKGLYNQLLNLPCLQAYAKEENVQPDALVIDFLTYLSFPDRDCHDPDGLYERKDEILYNTALSSLFDGVFMMAGERDFVIKHKHMYMSDFWPTAIFKRDTQFLTANADVFTCAGQLTASPPKQKSQRAKPPQCKRQKTTQRNNSNKSNKIPLNDNAKPRSTIQVKRSSIQVKCQDGRTSYFPKNGKN